MSGQRLDFVHLGGVGEDVGELSVNRGWGFSAVGVSTLDSPLTGQSASAVYTLARRVVRTKTE